MFAQPVRYLTLDNKWHDSFTIFDPSTGLPIDLTSMSATIKFIRKDGQCCDDYDWWGVWPSSTTASTTTGEIVNGGATGQLTVSVSLSPGTYKVRGDYSVGIVSTPFLNGELVIGRDGRAQMSINIVDGAGLIWSDGGVLATTGDVSSLPTTLPATPGILWNNGGVISIS
jgi:hypothetical protein